jgi:ectoine hydroxylase-related dioxygenase (phytanoyl-CoA dioxygenase family)
MVTILSKPAHGPPLYWHQDFMDWDHPSAVTPWPTRVFLGTYLTDTSKENGCLRVIPGTHRQRIDLHDLLPDAHEESVREATLESVAFAERNDAVDLPMQAGDLVVCDARTLHAAHANKSGKRRTMLLAWHDVFPFPSPPSWWSGSIPDVVRKARPLVQSERFKQRRPSAYLE